MNTALRIKKLREFRNYTQSHMAHRLDISQNAYSKIESGASRLTTDRLEKIAGILEVPVETIWGDEGKVFNIDNNHIEKFYIEHLHEENKDIFLKSLDILREQLEVFKTQNQALLETLQNLMEKG